MIKISKRLEKVASKVKKKSYVLDVGTDHGILPMYLIEKNIACSVIASDVVPSIVEKTKKEVSKNNMQDKIKVVLSDGLKDIDDKRIIGNKIDTIIIAGMGGILTETILKNRVRFVKGKRLILSPHRDVDLVRKYLHKIGYKIVSEDMIEDRNDKYYNVIVAEEGKDSLYNELDYKLGKKLINKRNKEDDFIKYLKYLIRKNENIIKKLEKSKNSNDKIKMLYIENEKYKKILEK